MKPILKDYFYGTKNELRAVVVLFSLIFICSILRFWGFESNSNSIIDQQDFRAKASIISTLNAPKINKSYEETAAQNKSSELFYFNPNTATKTDFERLGLSARTAQSIVNYRNKGGQFYKVEDFKKIYTLSDSDYERLAPFIELPTTNFGESRKEKEKIVENRPIELFEFNPNTASKTDFERLGLSARTAQSIINYRNKGGQFYKVEDFKKIYTLSDADFERLKSYINIPKKEKSNSPDMEVAQTEKPKPEYVKKSSTVIIDINKASVEDFQQLKGVGKGYAQRIIKYRDKLGGFTAPTQLKEVYGFPAETYKAIQKQLTIQSKTVSKININTATYEDLVRHPYIDSKRANAIVKYRKQHGNFKSVNDLSKIYAIPKSTLKLIQPYLKV